MDSLEHILLSTSDDLNAKHKALKRTEANLTQINLLIKNTGQYLAYKDIYRQYLNSKNKKQFREEHRTEISLYEAARKYLQENFPVLSLMVVVKPNSRFLISSNVKSKNLNLPL